MVVQNQFELGEGSTMPTDPHHTPTIIQSLTQTQKNQKPRKPKRKDTQVPQPSGPIDIVTDEAVHKDLGDSLVRVLDLEKTKTTQANEIASLKRRVKKLEKKRSSRTHKLKRLYKGRRIHDIDADEDITLVNVQDDVDAEMFDVGIMTGDEVFAEQEVVAKDVNLTVDEVTYAQALEA
ncbi:hypothetical protein Tco_0556300 [Tanacetum coccineum]